MSKQQTLVQLIQESISFNDEEKTQLIQYFEENPANREDAINIFIQEKAKINQIKTVHEQNMKNIFSQLQNTSKQLRSKQNQAYFQKIENFIQDIHIQEQKENTNIEDILKKIF